MNNDFIIFSGAFPDLVILRQDKVNLLVCGPNRPYFKQKPKNNVTKFWPTGFF